MQATKRNCKLINERCPLPSEKTSKWQKMVQRIESKAFDLGDYTDTFNQDRKEFR